MLIYTGHYLEMQGTVITGLRKYEKTKQNKKKTTKPTKPPTPPQRQKSLR